MMMTVSQKSNLTIDTEHFNWDIIKPITVLVIQLQQEQYQVFESSNQDICYEVVSGVLSLDVNPAVSLTTSDGSATGNLKI